MWHRYACLPMEQMALFRDRAIGWQKVCFLSYSPAVFADDGMINSSPSYS